MAEPATDDDLFESAARALSTRGRLDALLYEALVAPGMGLDPVQEITQMARTGELEEAEQALRQLRGWRTE